VLEPDSAILRDRRRWIGGTLKKEKNMPRVKRGTKRNDRRKKILKRASGYFLTKSKLYQAAQEAVERGLKFAYTGRRLKKRQYRSLWIVRIAAACKLNGTSYSQFISGLKKAGVELDRKILADIAVHDAAGFSKLVEQAKAAQPAKAKAAQATKAA
jgi:large subunit ribosomal protein L20